MSEFAMFDGGPRQHGRDASAPARPCTAYPIEALIRDESAGLRAFAVTRRLVRLVSEFDEGSYAALNIRTTDEQGRLEITIELHGKVTAEVTKADLVSALGEGVTLGDPTPTVPLPAGVCGAAYELVRSAVAPMFRSPGNVDRPEWIVEADLSDGPGFAAPLPNENDSGEPLLAAMARSVEQLWVRTVLGPADDLSARIVVDELNASMTRQGVADYVRVPVLARTMVMSSTHVPVAVRAALRQRGKGLRLVAVEQGEALQLWWEPMVALQSAAVAEAHAVAVTRIPSAGTMRALGVATQRPAVPERPLDPMPAPAAHPIRLGWATDAFGKKVAVELDANDLVRHFYIEGQSGSGKTTTIAQLFWSITRAGYQVIYLDPHGDGAERAAAYSSALADTTTYYVRHGDREHPVRINPLAEVGAEARERALSELLELIQTMLDPQREGMVGERFKRTFTIVAQATFELFGPRTSITDVLALTLTKESLRALAGAVRSTSPDAASRLEAELFSLGDKEFADLVSWFVSRLQPFLRTPALRDILGTGEDSLDIHDVLESGKNLIVDLASLELGEDVSRVLGALWLLKVRSAMAHRTNRQRPVVLLVDEAHLYTFGALPGLLAEARKFGIGIVIATQASDNLATGLVRAINGNCGSHFVLRVGIGSAAAASDRLGGWAPTQLMRLPDRTAAASLSRSGVPTQPFTLHIDHFEEVAQEGWDAHRISVAAAQVAADSLERMWAPHADRRVLNDGEVIASVKAAGMPRRRPSPTPPNDEHPAPEQGLTEQRTGFQGHGGLRRTDALLDRWLHNRGQDQHGN